MEARVYRTDGKVVIGLSGDIVHEDVDYFRQLLEKVYREQGKDIVLDVENTGYLNSAAVGAIAGLQRAMRDGGGSLVILNPQPAIARLLKVTRLDTVVTVINEKAKGGGR